MRPRPADDEGGDPSAWRAALRIVARGLQIGGGALTVAAWVMVRGRFEIVSEPASLAIGGVGMAALIGGSWLYPLALRTLPPQRD